MIKTTNNWLLGDSTTEITPDPPMWRTAPACCQCEQLRKDKRDLLDCCAELLRYLKLDSPKASNYRAIQEVTRMINRLTTTKRG